MKKISCKKNHAIFEVKLTTYFMNQTELRDKIYPPNIDIIIRFLSSIHLSIHSVSLMRTQKVEVFVGV